MQTMNHEKMLCYLSMVTFSDSPEIVYIKLFQIQYQKLRADKLLRKRSFSDLYLHQKWQISWLISFYLAQLL
jgi:hypothetical protein